MRWLRALGQARSLQPRSVEYAHCAHIEVLGQQRLLMISLYPCWDTSNQWCACLNILQEDITSFVYTCSPLGSCPATKATLQILQCRGELWHKGGGKRTAMGTLAGVGRLWWGILPKLSLVLNHIVLIAKGSKLNILIYYFFFIL